MAKFETRAEREAHVRKLRDQGMLLREIAAEMGVATQTVSGWLHDPGGKRLKARKDSYRGECVDCGARTDGSHGRDNAPERCAPCAIAREWRLVHEWILDSFREWHEMFGVPPTAMDWNQHATRKVMGRAPNYARRVIERYESTGRIWPSATAVRNHFGSWTEAVRAAGFEPLSSEDRWLGYRGRALRDEDQAA